MPFDLASVVTLAQDAGFRHIPHNIASSVGIFRYPETEWQVTVYYTTQTVATSIGHPLKRKSQLFRQNVTWTELAQIFEYPKSHIHKSLHRTTLAHNNSKEEDIIERDIEEESAIRSHLKNLEFQVRECQALLQTVLLKKQKEAEMKRKAEEQRWRIEEAAAKKARMEAEVRMEKLNKRGNKCIWSLKYDRDFPDMDDTVCVAIGDTGGYLSVADDGSCQEHRVPKDLYKIIKKAEFSGVDYVSMGPDGQYFVQLQNGKTYWDLGDDEYNQAFTDEYHSEGVEFVAFGTCDSFVIQFLDGSLSWNRIPKRLSSLLKKTRRRAVTVWLSTDGEGFLIAVEDGSYEVEYEGRFPRKVERVLETKRVKQFLYVEDLECYFVRYT